MIKTSIMGEELDNVNGKKRKWSRVAIGIFAAIFIILMIAYIIRTPGKTISDTLNKTRSFIFKSQNSLKPTPIPLPFAELTIPYLRKKIFKSDLGSLRENYFAANYVAYLTSYTSDGLKINALLTRPNGQEPEKGWPAIIFIHGYIPPSLYETNGQAYSAYVDYLAQNGFVVLKIDLRGHGNSEGRAGGGYFGTDYLSDALNAYAALQKADFVNPNKIGFWGHSMAGNTLLRSLAVNPDIPAVVIWAGAVYSYTDLQKYGINDQSYRPAQISQAPQVNRRKIFEKVGSPSASNVFWQKMAPVNYLKDLKGAIQLHHAVDDDVVSIGYSSDLVQLLEKNSVSYEFYKYESGGHNISGASFNLAMQRTVEFFSKYLKSF